MMFLANKSSRNKKFDRATHPWLNPARRDSAGQLQPTEQMVDVHTAAIERFPTSFSHIGKQSSQPDTVMEGNTAGLWSALFHSKKWRPPSSRSKSRSIKHLELLNRSQRKENLEVEWRGGSSCKGSFCSCSSLWIHVNHLRKWRDLFLLIREERDSCWTAPHASAAKLHTFIWVQQQTESSCCHSDLHSMGPTLEIISLIWTAAGEPLIYWILKSQITWKINTNMRHLKPLCSKGF